MSGQLDSRKLYVAEWAILDRKIIPPSPEANRDYRLHLERFDDHPELEGERLFMDMFDPELETVLRSKQARPELIARMQQPALSSYSYSYSYSCSA